MRVTKRVISRFLLSMAVVIASETIAMACQAPRVYFGFQSFEIRSSERQISIFAMPFIQKSSSDCRYRLVARMDPLEAQNDPELSIARRRVEAVLDAFQAKGVSRERFEIVVKVGGQTRLPTDIEGLRYIDRVVTIHPAGQKGVVICQGATPTCDMCVLKLPSGGECHLIPGGE